MEPLSELIRRTRQPGRVTWIGLRSARRSDMRAVLQCDIDQAGLVGDHGRAGKRAVTLMQAEHLGVIGSFLGRGPVSAVDLRRNLVVEGINLAALKGREFTLGSVRLRITGICAPCSRMEEAFGPGGYSAVRGHGGWCAEVVEPGHVRLGDTVAPAD